VAAVKTVTLAALFRSGSAELTARDDSALPFHDTATVLPTARLDAPVVLCLPAMGASADYYEPFAQAIAADAQRTRAVGELRVVSAIHDVCLEARDAGELGDQRARAPPELLERQELPMLRHSTEECREIGCERYDNSREE